MAAALFFGIFFASGLNASDQGNIQKIISVCKNRKIHIAENRKELCYALKKDRVGILLESMSLLQQNKKDLELIAHCSHDEIKNLRRWTDAVAKDTIEIYQALLVS